MKLFSCFLITANAVDISGCCQRLKITPSGSGIPQVFQTSGPDFHIFDTTTTSFFIKYHFNIRKFLICLNLYSGEIVNQHLHYDMVWPIIPNQDHFYLAFHQSQNPTTDRSWKYYRVSGFNSISERKNFSDVTIG